MQQSARPKLAQATKAGDYAAVLEILDREGASVPDDAAAYFRARAMIGLGRAEEALASLEGTAASSQTWTLRLRAYLHLGRLDDAIQALKKAGLAPDADLVFRKRISSAALEAGDFETAAEFGLKFRKDSPELPARFTSDLAALILLGDLETLSERLDLCPPPVGWALGHAMKEACNLARKMPEKRLPVDNRSLDAVSRLLSGINTMWEIWAGVYGGEPAPPWLPGLIWKRITEETTDDFIFDGPVPPGRVLEKVAPEYELVADWLGVPAAERPLWRARFWAAESANKNISAAVLTDPARRAEIAARLPEVDWSDVRKALLRGPVILTATHASLVAIMPIEFLRSGIDVRLVSSQRLFANVPEFLALHYHDLAVRSNKRLTRRVIEILKGKGCLFLAADGQVGAKVASYPEFGCDASLPVSLWPLAKRHGAEVFRMHTGWKDGILATRIEPFPPPPGVEDPEELNAIWHREVLSNLRDCWQEDVRNIHMNSVIKRVHRTG